MSEGYALVRPVALSCPECAGTLRREVNDGLLQFRCHIGHRLTAEAMLHAHLVQLEQRLGSCLSLLNERAELCRQLGEVARQGGRATLMLDAAREEALDRARLLRALLEERWLRPESELDPA